MTRSGARRAAAMGLLLCAGACTAGSASDGVGAGLAARMAAGTAPGWARQFGSPGVDAIGGVTLDGTGNVFVVGETGDTFDGQISLGRADAYAVSYDRDGTLRWARQLGTSGDDRLWGAAPNDDGDLFVVGSTNGAFPGQTQRGGLNDAFVALLGADGATRWVTQFGNDGDDEALAVAVDALGRAFVVGQVGTVFPGADATVGDAFVRAYDATGAMLWMQQFGGMGLDQATGVTVDAAGTVYVAGTFGGWSSDTQVGDGDAFVRALDPTTGAELWTRRFGASEMDSANGVGITPDGTVCAGGQTLRRLDGGDATIDALAQCYRSDGEPLWGGSIPAVDGGPARGLASSFDGTLLAVGNTPTTSLVELVAPDGTVSSPFALRTDSILSQVAATARGGRLCVVGATLGALPGETALGSGDAFVACYGP